jgi:dTMP kinase
MAKGAQNLTFDWARGCDVGLPMPDCCFFLDISADVAKMRGADYGGERYEKESMQIRVREEFHRLFDYEKHRNILVVDASKTFEEVSHEMQATVLQGLMAAVEEAPQLLHVLPSSEIQS